MATIELRGGVCHTSGELPAIGTQAPDFRLVGRDLGDVTLAAFAGKAKILNIVPSLDTSVCAESARKFNARGAMLPGVAMITVSADLPFAMSRFCAIEQLRDVIPLSMMRSRVFAKDYGVLIVDGPFEGVCARAVVVLDKKDRVVYTELVPHLSSEPNYEAALAAI